MSEELQRCLMSRSGVLVPNGRDMDYSRPLDVHRWSDHPEVRGLADMIWTTYFASNFEPASGKPGKRAKTHPKRQLRVLLLDLYVAWYTDPSMCIGVAMSRNAYNTGSRYNAIHISPIMIGLIHRAVEAGLVGFWRGSEGAGKVSRIWAEEPLVALFKRARFGILDIGHFPDEECIILSRGEGRWLPYEDTRQILEYRSKLSAYNSLLRQTFIDIPTLDRPVVELPPETEGKRPTLVRIDQSDKFVRRIFYRGDWQLGGRFHGGFWQKLPRGWRKQIHINERPVIEDDYRGTHVALLYGLAGQAMPNDPYVLDDLASEHDPKLLRKWVKSLVLVAINARNERSAFQAFRGEQNVGSAAKKFTDKTLRVILDEFRGKHPLIADRLCTDGGVSLMAIDGRIAARVIDHFTAKSIPVLTIHDSFLINVMHSAELRTVMLDSIKAEVPAAYTSIDREGWGFDNLPVRVFGQAVSNLRAIRMRLGYVKESEGYHYRRDQFQSWLREQPGSEEDRTQVPV